MTAPRIVQTEVVSFLLEVPVRSLERLAAEVSSPVVKLRRGEDEVTLLAEGEHCRLRFVVKGPRAQLAEVALQEDERGQFFENVLGALMVRFRGNLHLRFTWDVAERNGEGPFAEVTIRRGETRYPGLAPPRNLLAPGGLEGVAQALLTEGEEPAPELPTPEEQDVERVLARARAEWAEYQRLLAARAKGDS